MIQKQSSQTVDKISSQKTAEIKARETKNEYRRLVVIDREIAKTTFPSLKKLAFLCQSSEITIKRDIAYLRESFNAPIEYDREQNGYIYTNSTFRIPVLLNIGQQVEAAQIIRNLLQTLDGTPFFSPAKEILDTLSAITLHFDESDTQNRTTNYSSTFSHWSENRVIFLSAAQSNIEAKIWETLRIAIQQNRRLTFDYKAYHEWEPCKRTVEAWQLIHNGSWNLWSYCYQAKKPILYNLNQMHNLVLRDDNFTLPEDFDFRKQTNNTLNHYSEEKSHLYKIHFYNHAVHYCHEHIWSKDQTIEKQEDASIILSFTSNQYHPILTWLLSWGPDSIPLQPDCLVAEWKKKIVQMSKHIEIDTK